jgi:hypothetical protein
MNYRTELSQKQFKDLQAFLSTIKATFEDFSITQGRFRSRENENHFVLETFFDCFDQMDFVLGDVGAISRVLSNLDKTSGIVVTVGEDNVEFSDGEQSVNTGKKQDLFSNPFMSDDEMNEIFPPNHDENPIIEATLSKSVVSNIWKTGRDINTDGVTIMQEGGEHNKAYLVVKERGQAGGRQYRVDLKTGFLNPIGEGAGFTFNRKVYAFNKSDMIMKVRPGHEEPIVLIVHEAKLGDLSIIIHARAAIIREDP